MDVERLGQVAHGDGRTFQMPARPHVAPACPEVDATLQFTERRALEKREIHGAVLLVIIEINGPSMLNLAQVDIGESAIIIEFGDVEINGAEFFIGITLFHQFLHKASMTSTFSLAFG